MPCLIWLSAIQVKYRGSPWNEPDDICVDGGMMNQPLGRVILDAARAVLASPRLAREDFMAKNFYGL